jgi:hypothetical protein
MRAVSKGFYTRVARWYIFKPKIQDWVYFGRPWNRQRWYILWPFGIFQNHLVCFMAIWYILWSFGKIFPRFDVLYIVKSGNPVLHHPSEKVFGKAGFQI